MIAICRVILGGRPRFKNELPAIFIIAAVAAIA
jgi:hypothetical protein